MQQQQAVVLKKWDETLRESEIKEKVLNLKLELSKTKAALDEAVAALELIRNEHEVDIQDYYQGWAKNALSKIQSILDDKAV